MGPPQPVTKPVRATQCLCLDPCSFSSTPSTPTLPLRILDSAIVHLCCIPAMPPAPSSLLRGLARPPAPRAARAALSECIPGARRLFHAPRTSTSTLRRPLPILARPHLPRAAVRYESTPASNSPGTTTAAPESRLERDQVPAYELTFTCKACTTRSSHRVSKQGYHHGTVLISCPGCKNRHLISDHMKIFSDKSVTLEDLMREKGDLIKRGTLSSGGDVEFWDDGSTSPRSAHFHPNSNVKGDDDAPEGTLTEPPKPSEKP
ncbi:zf-DNL-domain-containing protein [Paraphaeosphaeria sporulosa]|uniref:Zf-DNL-domain-containing protein n=1 Tax=Paraphaeosphaeria sporulosa TaxID=1460663 RepID=A0A177CUY6_9PLEO|nr:zf-DNL-domain-containing protein [Paraphaeosphaeria sporulosa]OAG11333.1 zf-DNL-domain-containing protein [Paraphaeosphaeria sporulosa]